MKANQRRNQPSTSAVEVRPAVPNRAVAVEILGPSAPFRAASPRRTLGHAVWFRLDFICRCRSARTHTHERPPPDGAGGGHSGRPDQGNRSASSAMPAEATLEDSSRRMMTMPGLRRTNGPRRPCQALARTRSAAGMMTPPPNRAVASQALVPVGRLLAGKFGTLGISSTVKLRCGAQ